MENPPNNVAQPLWSWPLFVVGVLLFVLGPIIYAVQMKMGLLETPWYLPILSTFGILIMFMSAWRHRGVWRFGGLVLFVLLCGFEWAFILVITKTQPYDGPAKVGQKLPPYSATLASSGKDFTQVDVESGKRTAMIFFRGRW